MELKPPINLHQRRVLIVDDPHDGDTTDLLTYALERCGAIVAAATARRELERRRDASRHVRRLARSRNVEPREIGLPGLISHS